MKIDVLKLPFTKASQIEEDIVFDELMPGTVVISGYVVDLLESISGIADNFEVDGAGSCGKGYKEWVRVSDGGASIKTKVKIGWELLIKLLKN